MADKSYTVPGCIIEKLDELGAPMPATTMRERIQEWYLWWTARAGWYTETYPDADGRPVTRSRLSIRPARRICREWASLLASEVTLSADGERADAWLAGWAERQGFQGAFQDFVERTFALGTGALGLWADTEAGEVRLRRYDARMVAPISWDGDGVEECAMFTQAFLRGRPVDQLQLHRLDRETGTYHILTSVFEDGREVAVDGVEPDFDTGSTEPTFAVFRPAIENTYEDLSPYGVSVFADAVDAIKTVDMAWTALYDEVDLGRMMLMLPDSMIATDPKTNRPRPFGEGDAQRLYRLSASDGMGGDKPYSFTPGLRVDALYRAYGAALAQMGDLSGFGLTYFKPDKSGGVKTATEVAADSSELMRNVRKHEQLMGASLSRVLAGTLQCARERLGADVEPGEVAVAVGWDDSIVTDTASEKNMALAEIQALGVRELKVRYLQRYFGYPEDEAERMVPAAPDSVDQGF